MALNFSSTVLDDCDRVSISELSVFNVVVMFLPCAEDSSANFLISSATTANPFPASPAWAASIAAFIAKRFVWLAIFWITLLASIKPPDSSEIFCATLFDVATASFPAPVAATSSMMESSVLSMVCVMEAILATISSIDDEDCATDEACTSILPFNCFIVRIISSIVAAVSVTPVAWVIACCFTPSILALIWLMELAVSSALVERSAPTSSISCVFFFTPERSSTVLLWKTLTLIARSPNTSRRFTSNVSTTKFPEASVSVKSITSSIVLLTPLYMI